MFEDPLPCIFLPDRAGEWFARANDRSPCEGFSIQGRGVCGHAISDSRIG